MRSRMTLSRRWAGAGLLMLAVPAGSARAQELNPRSYSPNPTGGNILLLGYARSTGGVLFDPALPFDDVNATINAGSLLYGRTFGLFGRSASAQIALPYVFGDIDGLVEGEYLKRTRGVVAAASLCPRRRLVVLRIGQTGPRAPPTSSRSSESLQARFA